MAASGLRPESVSRATLDAILQPLRVAMRCAIESALISIDSATTRSAAHRDRFDIACALRYVRQSAIVEPSDMSATRRTSLTCHGMSASSSAVTIDWSRRAREVGVGIARPQRARSRFLSLQRITMASTTSSQFVVFSASSSVVEYGRDQLAYSEPDRRVLGIVKLEKVDNKLGCEEFIVSGVWGGRAAG